MTPAKLVASLPESIRVGPFDVGIRTMSLAQAYGAGEWGHFSQSAQEIVLQSEFPNAAKAADTLIHELNHAIWWAMGLQDGDNEERTVSTLATGWVQVYRDNPTLLDWLKKALK